MPIDSQGSEVAAKELRYDNREIAIEIAHAISTKLGHALDMATISWLDRPDGKAEVADSTLAFAVKSRGSGDDIVVLVSNERFPNRVAQNVSKASEARALLPQSLARHVLMPLVTGLYQGRSYAVYSRLVNYSDNRPIGFAQKMITSSEICRWLSGVHKATVIRRVSDDDLVKYFERPLDALYRYVGAGEEIKRLIKRAWTLIDDGSFELITSLEHGDFWIGNILFEQSRIDSLSPFIREFRVIDWGGALVDGYPCIDAYRYANSAFGRNSINANRFMRLYCRETGIGAAQMLINICLSLARLGCDLDQFPVEKYDINLQRFNTSVKMWGIV